MRSLSLLVPVLAVALFARPVSAQSTVIPVAGAIQPAPAPVGLQIFTLAWTDISLPPQLAAQPVTAPKAPTSDRVFTLAWQEVSRSVLAPSSVAFGSGCAQTVLVEIPCQ